MRREEVGAGTRDWPGSIDRYGGSENAKNAAATTISGATHGRRHHRGRAGDTEGAGECSVERVMNAAWGVPLTTGLPPADRTGRSRQ
ncbi:hypothetical protein ACFQYP_10515 [Nonomuraea antimicrobica]